MDENTVIHVENIHKSFKVFYDKGRSFKERLLFHERNRYEKREVLKGISFDVKKGEAIGLIGKNGCGKSTMLKLLTKIMYPTSGNVTTQGRVSALIELGAGFHPDMSGKENIYTNAAIFGLTKNEIDERLQAIIDFSELGSFIDNPVRTYSSGMYMRLAFAVAINVDADILLIDEILAVGDAAFQAKCFNKLREIKAKGTTIVIVSHSLGQIEQICDRSIWICDGEIRMQGAPRDVHPVYMEYMGKGGAAILDEAEKGLKASQQQAEPEAEEEKTVQEQAIDADSKNRWGTDDAKITNVQMLDCKGMPCNRYRVGDSITIKVDYEILNPDIEPVFGVGFFRSDGFYCYGTNTYIDKLNVEAGHKGCYLFNISSCPLMKGDYILDVAIACTDGFDCDFYKHAAEFSMYATFEDVGNIHLPHTWSIERRN